MPKIKSEQAEKPLLPGQIRVLRALVESGGILTRAKLAERLGNSATLIGKSIGYSDLEKRTAFEQTKDGGGEPGRPCPSLLTRGYVEEIALDIPEDGIHELGIQITPLGRQAAEALGQFGMLVDE